MRTKDHKVYQCKNLIYCGTSDYDYNVYLDALNEKHTIIPFTHIKYLDIETSSFTLEFLEKGNVKVYPTLKNYKMYVVKEENILFVRTCPPIWENENN